MEGNDLLFQETETSHTLGGGGKVVSKSEVS
jgi:hypothetical protein